MFPRAGLPVPIWWRHRGWRGWWWAVPTRIRARRAKAWRASAPPVSRWIWPTARLPRQPEGYLACAALGRPHVTLKLALSLDGCIALAGGESQWITGPQARLHVLRSRADAILVGGGTLRADAPRLDVRLPGLEAQPAALVLTHGAAPTEDGRRCARPRRSRSARRASAGGRRRRGGGGFLRRGWWTAC
jgi:hypothetical protein